MFARSDEALYQRLLGGDLSAFDALYERHARHLFGFVKAHLGDASEAEDVLHEAFLAVLRERDAGRSARSFRAWLFQVARHLCLNRLRSRKREARALEGVLREPAPPGAGQPEAALARSETSRALRDAVERLPTPARELYELRASGQSYEEIAEALAVPVGTVKSRMHELVRRLREEMA